MLRFHAKTFSLLGIEPSVSPSAVELLDQVEKRIGRPCRLLSANGTNSEALAGFYLRTATTIPRSTFRTSENLPGIREVAAHMI